MGIINIVQNVKKIHENYVVLIHVGNFYYCYGRDCYILSYLFPYKINILKNKIYSCSFPSTVLAKITNQLENKKINYIVLDKRHNYEVDEKQNFKNINTYQKYYEKGKEKYSTKMRIEKIYQYLMENINDKQLITEVEEKINERRKI